MGTASSSGQNGLALTLDGREGMASTLDGWGGVALPLDGWEGVDKPPPPKKKKKKKKKTSGKISFITFISARFRNTTYTCCTHWFSQIPIPSLLILIQLHGMTHV